MTLPPLVQNALKQLQQEQLAQAQATMRVVERRVEQTLVAEVTEASPLTDAERQQALQKLHKQLAASGPQAKEALQQLREWLREPQLNLVGLKAEGQQHYALTPKALTLHQMVDVLVRADGQLQLQSSPAAKLPGAAFSNLTATPASQLPAQIQAHWQNIASALRASLPHQKPVAALVSLLDQVRSALDALPPQQRDSILPPAVRRALDNLQRLPSPPAALAQPKRLLEAVRRSGVQLESTLATELQKPMTSLNDKTPAPRLSAAQILTNLQTTLARQSRAAASEEPIRPLHETDLKAMLLYAIKILQNHQVGPGQASQPKAGSASDSLVLSLLNLLQRTSPREKGFVNQRDQLMQALQQQVAGALAKIQTQQLQTLSQRLNDSASPTGGGYVELPVRLPDGCTTIGMHFQEYWSRDSGEGPETQETGKDDQRKVRQWEVMLEFDLGDAGELAAQLKVSQNTISANFWAAKTATRDLAQAQLAALRSELEESGLQVKDMRCLQGLPPQKQVKFNYNLVDIRT